MEGDSVRRRRKNSSEIKAENMKRITVGRANLRVLFWTCVTLIVIFCLMLSLPKYSFNRAVISQMDDQLNFLTKKHAVVIDAGSTGSRVLAFTFYKSVFSTHLDLVDELWHQEKPGISSYADNPSEAANSIELLLNKAKERIDKRYWKSTPVVLKATAGLRLLPEAKAEALVNTVKNVLLNSGFQQVESEPLVEIMPDLDEGIFSWVTINFLLDKLENLSDSAVALDLGGGSTQISFIPSSVASVQEAPEGYLHDRQFSGKNAKIYTKSYLGLGLMSARKAIIEGAEKDGVTFRSPCFTKAMSWSHQDVSMPIEPLSPGFSQCKAAVENVLRSKGIHSPTELASRHVVAFSYFYDRAVETQLVSSDGGQISLSHYKRAGEKACTDKESAFECIDLSFIYTLLSTYGLQDSAPIEVYKKINGHETSWALGAALHLLSKL